MFKPGDKVRLKPDDFVPERGYSSNGTARKLLIHLHTSEIYVVKVIEDEKLLSIEGCNIMLHQGRFDLVERFDQTKEEAKTMFKEATSMQEKDFRELAIKSVVDYLNSQADSTDKNGKITADQVFIVWMVKVLQNNKCLLSTTVADGMYYEFTWNGDKNEGYLDAYKKWKNITVKRE